MLTDFSLWIKDNLKDQTLLIKDKLLLLKESLLSYNGGFVFFDGRKINGWNVVFNGENSYKGWIVIKN